MQTSDLRAVPGVVECTLDDATAATLPDAAPPAPWNCESTGLIWFGRGGRAAAAAAGDAVTGGRHALAVVGGMIAYTRTPVGAYREVFGSIALRAGHAGRGGRGGLRARGTCPFMAVDSRASLVGGRQNWSLPKVLARFTGEPDVGGPVTAEGDGWQVRATPRAFGPSFPLRIRGRVAQPWPDGRVREATVSGRARGRSAVVTVEVRSEGDLARWLRPGRHLGVVLTHVSFALPAMD
jgi:Acetoacetate decarboxylase (ADC)